MTRLSRSKARTFGLQRGNLVRVDIDRAADDDLVARLAGARRRAIEDAAARAPLAEDDIGGDAGAGILVPDLDEFERQYSRFLAMIGVERDRAMIVDIGVCHVDPVQFGADNLAHRTSLKLWGLIPCRAHIAFFARNRQRPIRCAPFCRIIWQAFFIRGRTQSGLKSSATPLMQ